MAKISVFTLSFLSIQAQDFIEDVVMCMNCHYV